MLRIPAARAREWLALIAILAVAAALRFWGAFHDLPFIYHPDEPQNIVAIQQMLANRDPNPHLFLYPSLPYYLNALAGALRALPVWLAGGTPDFSEPISITMGATFAPDAGAVALYRSMTIFAGVLTVLFVHLAGKRMRDAATGLLAAALAAVSPLLVDDCRHVTVDSYVVLFEMLVLLASLAILVDGRRIAYIAAGLAIGATAASKYNGAIVCLFPAAAHVARCGLSPRASLPLVLAAGVSVAAFFCLTPFVLLDQNALQGVGYQFGLYSGRHQGMEGQALSWYLAQLWSGCGIAAPLALVALVLAWRRRASPVLIVAGFVLVYFAFISTFSLRNERTLLPLIPCVLLLAAWCAVELGTARSPLRRVAPALRQLALAVLGVALLVMPLRATIGQTIALTTPDSRATAREWINTQLAPGALVAVESYAPFVDPSRFRIVQAERAIDHPLQWYVEQHADYLVLSQGMFGRYYFHPEQYPGEAAAYRRLIAPLQLVREFRDGGYAVLVYRVPAGTAN